MDGTPNLANLHELSLADAIDLLFRRITHGASRLQEINADRVAAGVYGKEAFEEGLRHVIRRDVSVRYREAMAGQDPGDQTDHENEATASSHLVSSSSTAISTMQCRERPGAIWITQRCAPAI